MNIANEMMKHFARPAKMTGEIRPTEMASVIAPNKFGKCDVFPMIWGFYEKKLNRPLVNFRVETANIKPIWSDSWKQRRCVIPASYYYEWEHYADINGKIKIGEKYIIQPSGSDVTYLAGLYRIEEIQNFKYPVFAVLTREPTDELRQIHNRMPLILPETSIEEWINPEGNPDNVLKTAVTDLIVEKA